MEEAWKGMLLEAPKEECTELPCPSSLLKKILVKVKHVYTSTEKIPSCNTTQSAGSASSPSESEDQSRGASPKRQKKSQISKALSDLGIYTHSYHFKSLTEPNAIIPTHVFSLSERKLMEVHQSHGPTLFSHNRNYMMRAFPSGTRISSSNLDPSLFWRKGVQMVALNWQKWDEGMMLNEGMFANSGGWVLKPVGYRGNAVIKTQSNHESQADAVPHKCLDLIIILLAAQNLPLPTGHAKSEHFHPYVKCELHVERPEERSGERIEGGGKSKEGEYKRQSRTSKGIDPDFGGESMKLLGVNGVVEELSFVR